MKTILVYPKIPNQDFVKGHNMTPLISQIKHTNFCCTACIIMVVIIRLGKK